MYPVGDSAIVPPFLQPPEVFSRMANIQSQKKRNRQNETARIRNKSVRSELNTRTRTAVEAADTRSWLSLPGAIGMARLEVPAGTNDLVLEFLDGRGQPLETRIFPQIEVAAGQTVFLNARSFR